MLAIGALVVFCIGALPPGSGLASAQTLTVDANIPPYPKGEALSGSLNSVGSDTLLNLMTFWAEAFQRIYPNVSIQIEGKGSSTAPPALIAGASQVGPMSRRMKAEELRLFEDRFGYEPTAIAVAIDALAVYVNKDNSLTSLSLPQVDAIFSRGRRGGYPRPIDTWGEAGLSGSWSGLPIALYGRNSASGTYAYFKKVALFKGDYRDSVKEQPGSSGVVSSVAADRYGVGYSGIGYRTSEVRTLSLSKKDGGKVAEATTPTPSQETTPWRACCTCTSTKARRVSSIQWSMRSCASCSHAKDKPSSSRTATSR